ncbi:MAG: hypothetical protein A3K65_02495 [Euryarchaeota archaeon RBG_16_68_12]|nr:MAG: hypothetical protein A3K65_02495 [Euryarchaeota archaeon RBG_16_68_12]
MVRLPGEVDGRRFLRAMARLGWMVVAQSGRFIFVAFHGVIRRNAIRNILKLAGTPEDEFLRVL